MFMTIVTLATMIFVTGSIGGGFALMLFLALRQNKQNAEED